jgi:hypothetical protein
MGVEAYPEDRVIHGLPGSAGAPVGIPAGAVARGEA